MKLWSAQPGQAQAILAAARSHKVALLLGALWVVVTMAAVPLGFAAFLDQQLMSPMEFRVRRWLNVEPPLSQRLKIYAFDDKAAAVEQGDNQLPQARWPALLQGLAAARPRAILIAQQFSTSSKQLYATDREAIAALRNLPIPTVAMVLLTPNIAAFRQARLDGANRTGREAVMVANPYRPPDPMWVYGPEGAFNGIFAGLGHTYQPWPDRFAPFVEIKPGWQVPHLALFAADRWENRDGSLYLDGQPLHASHLGLAPVNFITPDAIAARIKTFAALYNHINDHTLHTEIDPGDIVLLVNSFGAGQSVHIPSPFGPMPAAWYLAAITNSVLTGRWLTQIDDSLLMILLAACFGALSGWRIINRRVALWVLGVLAVLWVAELGAFLALAYRLPVLMPALAFGGAASIAFSARLQNEQRRRLHLDMERQTAATLQRDFMPHPKLTQPAFSLAAYYQAAEEVGGDWFTYHVSEDRWLILHVGDVTGHGTPAALCASFAMGAIDALQRLALAANPAEPPLHLLQQQLNSIFFRAGYERLLLTLVSVAIDLRTGVLWCFNTAQPPAVILRRGGQAPTTLSALGSPIIGSSADFPILEPQKVQLRRGDFLVLSTDGINAVMRTLDRVRGPHKEKTDQLLESCRGAQDLCDRLVERLRAPRPRQAHDDDDVTLIVIEWHGADRMGTAS